MLNPSPRAVRWSVAALLGAIAGCSDASWDKWLPKNKPPPEPAPKAAAEVSPVLVDTIGAKTVLGSVQPVILRGFGVVVGLGQDGGSDCPTTVREYLIDYFQREYAPDGAGGTRPRVSPQKLLESPDSAVVQIMGIVQGGARKGARFDLQVEALGTQTRSLEGGLLLPCALRIFDASASGRGMLAGQTLARAQGPVYTKPGGHDANGSRPNVRRGMVLGGGMTLEDRPARLLLNEPSYALARRMENRINERFGQSPPAAEAVSMGYIQISTPAAYAERPERYLQLAAHLYLENSPGYVEQRMRELLEQIRAASDRLNSIALIWEGIGPTAIPSIQPLYSDPDARVRLFAARAGVRLGDASAVPVLAALATERGGAHQLDAVRELAECGLTPAALRLASLLDHGDGSLRIAAYEGLRRFRHPSIVSRSYPSPLDPRQPSLTLDVVDSSGPPLIYVRQSREPLIAVFGKNTAVHVPVFYSHPREWVTLNALEGADLITLYARTRRSGVLSDHMFVAPRVVDLVHRMASLPVKGDDGRYQGLGLHYAVIVEALGELCRNGAIPAQFVLETPALPDLLAPSELPERPEGEPPAASEPAPELPENADVLVPKEKEGRPE
ncbi:MAG: flagellar basal body P-ring protein FlgI [Phycisphaerae bacterium]|jgi:hypothetical protein